KGHGTENDFVLLVDPAGELALSAELVTAICSRRSGVGADGILRVVRAAAVSEGRPYAESATWFMDYRNADGSLAEMCGNGIRVYARYLVDSGRAPRGRLRLATRDGLREVSVPGAGDVTVDMGRADVATEPSGLD